MTYIANEETERMGCGSSKRVVGASVDREGWNQHDLEWAWVNGAVDDQQRHVGPGG